MEKTASEAAQADAYAETTEHGEKVPLAFTFLALIPNYWGKGETREEAIAQLKKHTCGGKTVAHKGFCLSKVAHDPRTSVYVNDMGGLSTKINAETLVLLGNDFTKHREIWGRTEIVERRNGRGNLIDANGKRI